MNEELDKAAIPGKPPHESAGPVPDLSGTALPRPVQEHLAKQLRAEYQLVADKPAFLGDPAIPVEFEHHLARMDRREKAHERGVEAVKAALDLGLGEDGKDAPAAKRSGG